MSEVGLVPLHDLPQLLVVGEKSFLLVACLLLYLQPLDLALQPGDLVLSDALKFSLFLALVPSLLQSLLQLVVLLFLLCDSLVPLSKGFSQLFVLSQQRSDFLPCVSHLLFGLVELDIVKAGDFLVLPQLSDHQSPGLPHFDLVGLHLLLQHPVPQLQLPHLVRGCLFATTA